MRLWLMKAIMLTVIGIVCYRLTMTNGGSIYHFPWEVFATLGIAGYVLKEVAKLFKLGEKK
ncbi:Uncharacterised protein [Streptococcus constellatus]|uniref:Alanine aminotransferase n=2 Tax=Streptococcus constellatus TaxID=76860 RepID=A0A564TRV5_STRCV|nr:Uncharacterised protein [Streptococcus gordonii]VUX09973.1 Uncharacterised protein [Streptococcus constellatus]